MLRLMSGDSLRSAAASSASNTKQYAPPQVNFPENRNAPAGRAGHRCYSCLQRSALIKKGDRSIFRPKLETHLAHQAVCSGEIEPAAARHHGSVQQEVRGLRAHASQLGGCELELAGADEFQLLGRSSTLPNWGRGRPSFSRKEKTRRSSRRRVKPRGDRLRTRDNGIGILASVPLFGTTKSARAPKCTSGVGRRRHDAVW